MTHRLGPGLLLLLATASACATWRVDHRPVPEVVASHSDNAVAVSMRDLRRVVLHKPRIENDSIVGSRGTTNAFRTKRAALPLRDVTAVETQRFDLIRTIALGAFVAFLPTIWKFATVEED